MQPLPCRMQRPAGGQQQHSRPCTSDPAVIIRASTTTRRCRSWLATRAVVVRSSTLQSWWSTLVASRPAAPQADALPTVEQFAAVGQPAARPGGSRGRSVAKRDYLEARQVSLFHLFDGREFVFEIPPYQRPFCWSTKQVHELLQDFMASYRARSEYFLGAIVTVRGDPDANSAFTPLQVIDGQQRLTSLLILLAYVHAWARQHHNPVLETRIKRMLYLEPDALDPSQDAQGRFRLRLREGDEAFFVTNLLAAWLPIRYQLSGVAAITSSTAAPSQPPHAEPTQQAHSTWPGAAPRGPAHPQPQAPAHGVPSSGPHPDSAAAWQHAPKLHLAPPGPSALVGVRPSGALAAGAARPDPEAPRPIENESWWRMYECAAYVEQALGQASERDGVRLAEFVHHVLTHCHVVLMTARDEVASFRIFSTINSRGMDLSAVDKLKADLLEVLDPSQRRAYSCAWSEMEDVLGRAAFQRVFDYMRALAVVVAPEAQHMSVLEYFSPQQGDTARATATINCALNYARLLLQLRQCRFEVAPSHSALPLHAAAAAPAPAAAPPAPAPAPQGATLHAARHRSASADAAPAPWGASSSASVIATMAASAMTAPSSASAAAAAAPAPAAGPSGGVPPSRPAAAPPRAQPHSQVLPAQQAVAASNRLLSADERGGIVTSWDDGGPQSAVHTHGAIRQLERQARHVSLLTDDAWLPPTLDFFQQVEDLELRTKYLACVETLQLYLELCCDAATAAQRWRAVSEAVLHRLPDTDQHLHAVFSALALTHADKAAFRLRLHHKDLYSLAPHRTLAHLLLRAEGAAVSTSPTLDLAALHVERIVPHGPPEGSQWRKAKLAPTSPSANGAAAQPPGAPTPLTSSSSAAPSTSNGTKGSPGVQAEDAPAGSSSASAASSSTAAAQQQQAGTPQRVRRRSPTSPSASAPAGGSAGAAVTASGDGFKYWFEVQRATWSGKLGNLILLPTTPAAATLGLHDADYEVKAAYYRECGVEALLPEWSGAVVSGRFSRQRFSMEECKARHNGLHARLVEVLRLREDEDDPLEPEDDFWPEESVY